MCTIDDAGQAANAQRADTSAVERRQALNDIEKAAALTRIDAIFGQRRKLRKIFLAREWLCAVRMRIGHKI